MANAEINNYITRRYDRWLDYARYHTALAGIPDEAIDVLNEVLYSLLRKEAGKLAKILHTKKDGYSELDFFVLRMIKLNAHSPTSPYRNKYRAIPADTNVDYAKLDIEDAEDQESGNPDEFLERFHQVREIFDSLMLSDFAKRVFAFRFFEDQAFSEWGGPETLKELYDIYNGVQDLIRKKINGECLF